MQASAERIPDPMGVVSSYEEKPGVCVIEDDEDLREAIETALRDEGYRVLGLEDGTKIIGGKSRFVVGFGPMATVDVLVTDQRMPTVSGLEVLSHVRRTDWTKHVILMSAYVDDELLVEAYRLGVAAILAKPFSVERLIEAVEHFAPLS